MSEATTDFGREGLSESVPTVGSTALYPGEATDGPDAAALRERFGRLFHEWKDATRLSSSITEVAMHPAYQQIIGMGKDAIPLIVAELRKEPDHWFWALQAITGEDPVDASDCGRVRRMADAWLAWAKKHGYG
jgi:hypothetical protein